MQPFSDRNGGADLLAHLPEGVVALDRHRLLEPVDLAGILQRPAEPDRGRHVETAMGVDQDFDLRPSRLTDQGGEFGRLALALLRHLAVEIAMAMSRISFVMGKRIKLDSGVAGVDDLADLLDHALPAGELRLVGMRVDKDIVAHRPAEQLVDRRIADLADNVPERDVDSADHMGRRPARAHIGEGAERLVPQLLDAGRVVPYQQVIELAQDRRDGAVCSLVVVVISPQPETPASVLTSTNRNSPQNVRSTLTSQGMIAVIFIFSS